MNILIVEDEIVVAMDLKKTLKFLGYNIIAIASNYKEVKKILQNHQVDIILMDINLEDSKYDGIEIASKIALPVIYITAFSDDETIKRSVQTNPLGYIVKPFKEEELKVNIELARYKLQTPYLKIQNEKIELGKGYYFDKKLEELYFNEMPILLGKYEKQLLMLLIDAKGNVVPFSRIDYEIWGDNTVSESTRRMLLYRLRSKLEHKFIETISGVGCKLVLK